MHFSVFKNLYNEHVTWFFLSMFRAGEFMALRGGCLDTCPRPGMDRLSSREAAGLGRVRDWPLRTGTLGVPQERGQEPFEGGWPHPSPPTPSLMPTSPLGLLSTRALVQALPPRSLPWPLLLPALCSREGARSVRRRSRMEAPASTVATEGGRRGSGHTLAPARLLGQTPRPDPAAPFCPYGGGVGSDGGCKPSLSTSL